MLEVPSPVDGVLKEIKFSEGDTVTSQQVLAVIEEGAAKAADAGGEATRKASAPPATRKCRKEGAPRGNAAPSSTHPPRCRRARPPTCRRAPASPAEKDGIDPSQVQGTGRRGAVTKEDLVNFAAGRTGAVAGGARPEERVPMTRIRKRIAERLMHSKDSIAMLTSFNEINLGKVMAMRKELGESFMKQHGVKLGFMSFFAKAAANALQRFDHQRLGRRRRHHLPAAPTSLGDLHRPRPGHAGAAQRRAHELRRDRAGHRRLRQGRARGRAQARGPAGRHVHHHQRRHLRLAVLDPDREPAAVGDPRHARDQGARDRRGTARSWPRR